MRIAAWIVLTVGGLFLAFLLLSGAVMALAGTTPMPEAVSNESRDLEVADGPFRVVVLGDSQKGLSNLTNIVRAARKEEPVLFLHTGDLVSHNNPGHYRLAALALARSGVDVPFAVAPGNHDIKGGPELFEREIGATEWVIRVGGVVFAGFSNSRGVQPDPAQLDALVAPHPDREIVLLMHIPPFDVEGNLLPVFDPFVTWLRKGKVRYVFAGHIHDYIRKEIGKTVVIANGVGGDYDNWQLDQRVFATVLEWDGARLVDRPLEIPPDHGILENLEHLAVGHIREHFAGRPMTCWGLTLLALVLVGGSIRTLRRKAP